MQDAKEFEEFKKFENAIRKGHPYWNRLKICAGKLLFLNVQKNETYKIQASECLTNLITKLILDKETANLESDHKHAELLENYRLQVTDFLNLLETAEGGLVLEKCAKTEKGQNIFSDYKLREVPDVPNLVIRGIQIQTAMGLGFLFLGLTYYRTHFMILRSISDALLVEAVTDLMVEATKRDPKVAKLPNYCKAKLLAYASASLSIIVTNSSPCLSKLAEWSIKVATVFKNWRLIRIFFTKIAYFLEDFRIAQIVEQLDISGQFEELQRLSSDGWVVVNHSGGLNSLAKAKTLLNKDNCQKLATGGMGLLGKFFKRLVANIVKRILRIQIFRPLIVLACTSLGKLTKDKTKTLMADFAKRNGNDKEEKFGAAKSVEDLARMFVAIICVGLFV